MSAQGNVVSVNISEKKGVIKHATAEIVLNGSGIVNDAHAGPWHRQVSLLSQEDIDRFIAEMGKQIAPGEFAENITTAGLDLGKVAVLDTFRIGKVELEVTQIGKKCHGDGCAIFQEVGQCVMPKQGLFGRVVSGGSIKPGDKIEHLPRPLKILIVTLSDRAFAGEYTDRSGPRVAELLGEHFAGTRWHSEIENILLADDAEKLTATMQQAIADKVDVIFTLGGTGVGQRDITPEAVASLCDKIIPGIMENIRLKFGAEKSVALLSRGIAGMTGTTQIYTLPGSVRAVQEYTGEILKTLEHLIFMAHGLDVH
jgi:molybdopterin adenylyltransferase